MTVKEITRILRELGGVVWNVKYDPFSERTSGMLFNFLVVTHVFEASQRKVQLIVNLAHCKVKMNLILQANAALETTVGFTDR